MQPKEIIVVGGGPAGIMAAIAAKNSNTNVVLLEKNLKLGRKLLLTGKGRCNFTNDCDLASFFKKFSNNGDFLRDAFKEFFKEELVAFFTSRGVDVKVERQNRVFPVTDKAGSVLNVLTNELKNKRVKVSTGAEVKHIKAENNEIKGVVTKDKMFVKAERVIFATGGVSYPETGSTGDGFDMARELGHTIVPLRPHLVPLEIKQKEFFALSGLTLKNIRLKFICGKKQIISEIGELLFTKFGISGPLVISLSGQVVDLLSIKKDVIVEIDLKPALTYEQLDNRMLNEIKNNPKKTIGNLLREFLPVNLINIFLNLSGIDCRLKSCEIKQEHRKKLVNLFKGFRLDILKARPMEEAMVTQGGISLKEINPKTMESKIVKGLYFAGEVMDIDADTGGFNLQAAFSSGFLAGRSAANV